MCVNHSRTRVRSTKEGDRGRPNDSPKRTTLAFRIVQQFFFQASNDTDTSPGWRAIINTPNDIALIFGGTKVGWRRIDLSTLPDDMKEGQLSSISVNPNDDHYIVVRTLSIDGWALGKDLEKEILESAAHIGGFTFKSYVWGAERAGGLGSSIVYIFDSVEGVSSGQVFLRPSAMPWIEPSHEL